MKMGNSDRIRDSWNRAHKKKTGWLTTKFLAASLLGLSLSTTACASLPQDQSAQTQTTGAQTDFSILDALKSSPSKKADDMTVRLTGPISSSSSIAVINQLLELSKKDPKAEITLRIQSPGGSVTAGMAIYDVMQTIPNDVRTVCEGQAASMAAMILAGGTPGKRVAYENCEIMFHQPSWSTSGKISDMEVTTEQGKRSREAMIDVLSKHTGWDKETMRDFLDRDFFISAEEAKKMGFVDNLIEAKPVPAQPKKDSKNLPVDFCDHPERERMRICRP